MNFFLQDDVLESLLCHNCQKYLSVKPIKVYPDRSIKCGRCSKKNDGGVVSLFEHLAEKAVFRCINRYEGCNKALSYVETEGHEAKCLSLLYNCPLCTLAGVSSYLLVLHFKTTHEQHILAVPEFTVRSNAEENNLCFIFFKGDFIFIIYADISLTENCVRLKTISVGPKFRAKKITQRFLVFHNKILLYQSKKVPCATNPNEYLELELPEKFIVCKVKLELNTERVKEVMLLPLSTEVTELKTQNDSFGNFKRQLHLSDEFKSAWGFKYCLSEDKNMLQFLSSKKYVQTACNFCENLFMRSSLFSVFKIKNIDDTNLTSTACSSCYYSIIKYLYSKNDYECSLELTEVFKKMEYFCRWGCGFVFKPFDKHEFGCNEQSLMKCPTGCNWSGKLGDLENHFSIYHKDSALWLHGTCISYKKIRNERKIFFKILDNFVKLKFVKLDNSFIVSMSFVPASKNQQKLEPVALVAYQSNIRKIFTGNFFLETDAINAMIFLRDFS